MVLGSAFRRERVLPRCLAFGVAMMSARAAWAQAVACTVVESRSSLPSLSGTRITSVEVSPRGVVLPAAAQWAAGLHANTRDFVVRRRLLFAAGDTLDTLAVAETMRRLRRDHTFTDAVIEARSCPGVPGVELSLTTHDAWTLRPTIRARSTSAGAVGLEDRNLLGTGRTLSVSHEMDDGTRGTVVRVNDPTLFGGALAAGAAFSRLPNQRGWSLSLRKAEYTVFERWRGGASFAAFDHTPTRRNTAESRSVYANVTVGRLVRATSTSALALSAVAELDSVAHRLAGGGAGRDSSRSSRIVGRSFAGLGAGVVRRTVAYDTASWFMPRGGLLDVPMQVEFDAIVLAGHDRVARAPAARYDLWGGRMWMPRRGVLLTTDLWAIGFAGPQTRRNAMVRVALGTYAAAPRGLWRGRLMAEQESRDLDPDLRPMSPLEAADPTLAVLGRDAFRSSRAVVGWAERDVHVLAIGSRAALDVAVLAGASYRSRFRQVGAPDQGAAVVGVGLRLLQGSGSLTVPRLDIVYPVAASFGVQRRLRYSLQFGLSYDGIRQREGRRIR